MVKSDNCEHQPVTFVRRLGMQRRGRSGGGLRLRTVFQTKIRNLCFVIRGYAKAVTHLGLESFFFSFTNASFLLQFCIWRSSLRAQAHAARNRAAKPRDEKVAPLQQTPSHRIALLFAARARDSKVSLLTGYGKTFNLAI